MRLSELMGQLERLQAQLLLDHSFALTDAVMDPEIAIEFRWGDPAHGTLPLTGIHQVRTLNSKIVITPDRVS